MSRLDQSELRREKGVRALEIQDVAYWLHGLLTPDRLSKKSSS